jgi:hypothetical protein
MKLDLLARPGFGGHVAKAEGQLDQGPGQQQEGGFLLVRGLQALLDTTWPKRHKRSINVSARAKGFVQDIVKTGVVEQAGRSWMMKWSRLSSRAFR